MGKLLVVRHGETESNALGRYCGSQDVPLNDTGVAQAEAAAENLPRHEIDVVICSPLRRARQTAELLMPQAKETMLIWDDFRERCMGVYEGLTREEIRAQYPLFWQQDALRQLDFAPDGAETMREVRERVIRGMERIIANFAGKTVLLVTHGYVSREIHRYFNQLTDEEMHAYSLGNCVIATYEF
ncbi:MAG: histidine phosphatase family protein [Bacillota bacterium]|jgi:broad specificity phosphatase PhoE